MTTRTRMNVYFDPELLKQVEALSLRRQVSKSAIVEAAVASFLSGDTSDRLEAAMSRRLDKIGRQIGTLDEDLAVLGETLSLFVHFWLTMTRSEEHTSELQSLMRISYAVFCLKKKKKTTYTRKKTTKKQI